MSVLRGRFRMFRLIVSRFETIDLFKHAKGTLTT